MDVPMAIAWRPMASLGSPSPWEMAFRRGSEVLRCLYRPAGPDLIPSCRDATVRHFDLNEQLRGKGRKQAALDTRKKEEQDPKRKCFLYPSSKDLFKSESPSPIGPPPGPSILDGINLIQPKGLLFFPRPTPYSTMHWTIVHEKYDKPNKKEKITRIFSPYRHIHLGAYQARAVEDRLSDAS